MSVPNPKNPAIRRIMADVRELAHDPSDQYAARPLEDNMFDWHFVIRGPKGTDYEGGVYHGRIVLPKDYPFKPPSIMLLTPNGRWETKQKICLSISSYHPEQWQPAWGIRTILEAIISFMVTPAEGAVGALECSSEVRKKLARESRKYKHPLMPELPPEQNEDAPTVSSKTQEMYANQVKQLHVHKLEKGRAPMGESNAQVPSDDNDSDEKEHIQLERENLDQSMTETSVPRSQDVVSSVSSVPTQENEEQSRRLSEAEVVDNVNVMAPNIRSEPRIVASQSQTVHTRPRPRRQSDAVDTFLHHLSIGLMMAIFAILYRKALQFYA